MKATPLTVEQAVIISAYTGYFISSFSDMHEYVEKVMGRPVWTHEMGNATFMESLREKTKADFIALAPDAARQALAPATK